MKTILLGLSLMLGGLLAGCSNDEPAENVFKAQTDALNKAEDANRLLEEAAAAQRKAIEQQSQ